jgi:hypothetical protein
MGVLVPITLFGWIPVVLLMFAFMGGRRAVFPAFVLAWLFLPLVEYKMPGFPGYSKVTATSFAVLLGALIFDTNRILNFRPRLLDLPMLVWCICPFFSSITNELGAYDGASAAFFNVALWGLPYFIGRCYLTDLDAVRDLAVWIFIGGLLYTPLCLIENRLSPQLNKWVYGFTQLQTVRYYESFMKLGWQPLVFMQNSLALTMFMVSAALIGTWLWATGALRRLMDMPMSWLLPPVFLTSILCKSLGPITLMFTGLGILFITKWMRWSTLVAVLCFVPVL